MAIAALGAPGLGSETACRGGAWPSSAPCSTRARSTSRSATTAPTRSRSPRSRSTTPSSPSAPAMARPSAASTERRSRSPTRGSRARRTRSRCLTSTGGTIEHEIPVAAETPSSDVGFFGLMALLGLYVGVIPVSLGMLWLPVVRRIDARWIRFLLAFTIGLLAVLGIEAALEGPDIAGSAPSAFGGATLVFIGGLVAYLALSGVDAYLDARRRRSEANANSAPGAAAVAGAGYLALLVALGIGLHNLGEGLAIGSVVCDRGTRARRPRSSSASRSTTPPRASRSWRRSPARGVPGIGSPARAGSDRRRPGDPRSLDRGSRVQPQPGGPALRGRGRAPSPR